MWVTFLRGCHFFCTGAIFFAHQCTKFFRVFILFKTSILLDFTSWFHCSGLMSSTIFLIKPMLIPLPLIHSFRNFDLISAITFSAALSWGLYGGIVMQGIHLFVINFVDSLFEWTDEFLKSIHGDKDSSSSTFKLTQTSSIN